MTINQERFTTYKPLSPVLRTRTTSEVQIMTDHTRRKSVKKYASVQLEEKRRLFEGK
jgi:hypothetical protein